MTDRDDEPELRAAEAARIAGISPSTLHRYAQLGYIRFRTLPSGQRRYRRSWLEQDLNPDRDQEPTP